MDAFSLLKYWKKGAGAGGDSCPAAVPTTLFATVESKALEAADGEGGSGGGDDDGSFFDLELTGVAEEHDGGGEQDGSCNGEDGGSDDEEGKDDEDAEGNEFDFTVSSGSSPEGSPKDRNPSLSPSDDLLFKGKLVCKGPEANPKKLAAKLKVFMLRLKRLKSASAEKEEPNGSAAPAPKSPPQQQNHKEQKKFFTVKFKVEEAPIVSLFTRDNSSRISAGSGSDGKAQKQSTAATTAGGDTISDEKRFSKDMLVQKYLKMVKPLYVRASKRYGDKVRFSGQLSLGSPPPPPPHPQTTAEKMPPAKSASFKSAPGVLDEPPATVAENGKNLGNIPAVLRVVCKRLGQSRSASAMVAAAPAAASAAAVTKRRDDSLLEQQDGIQGAILHCKRSFNGFRDAESTHLSRSPNDPYHEKSMEDLQRRSAEEASDLRPRGDAEKERENAEQKGGDGSQS